MSTSSDAKVFPEVETFPELKPYWEAIERRQFVVPECSSCRQVHWYPRCVCPHCGSFEIAWRKSAGAGHVYSYSVLRRAAEPYVLAYIELDEGIRLLSNVVRCNVDDVAIGSRVRLVFVDRSEGLPMPMFELDIEG